MWLYVLCDCYDICLISHLYDICDIFDMYGMHVYICYIYGLFFTWKYYMWHVWHVCDFMICMKFMTYMRPITYVICVNFIRYKISRLQREIQIENVLHQRKCKLLPWQDRTGGICDHQSKPHREYWTIC